MQEYTCHNPEWVQFFCHLSNFIITIIEVKLWKVFMPDGYLYMKQSQGNGNRGFREAFIFQKDYCRLKDWVCCNCWALREDIHLPAIRPGQPLCCGPVEWVLSKCLDTWVFTNEGDSWKVSAPSCLHSPTGLNADAYKCPCMQLNGEMPFYNDIYWFCSFL